jgi:RNA polymerase sigma-70 factor, ECF subfamily
VSAVPLDQPLEIGRGPQLAAEGPFALDQVSALISAVAAKEPGADKALVDRFKGHVHRLLLRMLGPGPDLEDLLQEALFRVFQRLHKVDPPNALPGYVTAVTVLVAREALRKRRRARWLSFFSSDDLVLLSAKQGSPDVPEDVRAFYQAVAKLPEQSQVCVTLRHVEGMGLSEIAVAMGVSLATIKRHLQRAEAELVAVLGLEHARFAPWFPGKGGQAE